MSDRIEKAARAIWAQRQKRFEEIGATPLPEWEHEAEVCKNAVRAEAAAALASVE